MGNIASKSIATVLDTAAARFELDVPRFLESVPADTSAIGDPQGRIPWKTFAVLLERLEAVIGGRDATRVFFDASFDRSGRRRFLGDLAALFTDSRQLYRYAVNVYVPAHFPIVERSLERQPDGTWELRLGLPIELPDCAPFWWGIGSLLARLPHLLGQSDALVDVEVGDRLAIYRITPPPPLTIAARLRNSFLGFFAHQSAAEMANEQGREIAQVYDSLVQTRERLEAEIVRASHREQQRVAHDLHDGLGQQLTAVSLQVKLLEHTLQNEAPQHVPAAAKLMEDVREASQLARSLAHGLDELGQRERSSHPH